jgi:hypothetical protein
MRARNHHLGIVYAPDERSAEVAANRGERSWRSQIDRHDVRLGIQMPAAGGWQAGSMKSDGIGNGIPPLRLAEQAQETGGALGNRRDLRR